MGGRDNSRSSGRKAVLDESVQSKSDKNRKDNGQTIIWSVGELGGGTNYFGRDNLLGLYRMFKDRVSNSNHPDMIVFHGELLPEIPRFISKGGRQRSLVISELVESVDESAVMMKPHLTRITDIIKAKNLNTCIVYIMGHSDQMNLEREYDILNNAFNYDPKHLFVMRKRYRDILSDVDKKIESLSLQISEKEKKMDSQSLQISEKGSKTGGGDISKTMKKLGDSIVDLSEKRSQKMSERNDFGEIKDLYTKLIHTWLIDGRKSLEYILENFSDYLDDELYHIIGIYRGEDAEILSKKYKTELEKIIQKIKSIGERNGSVAEIAKLEKRSKEIGNLLTKISNEIIVGEREKEERNYANRLGQGLRFTNNMPGTPGMSRIANELASKIVISRIKDVFGRRIDIDIVADNYRLININNKNIFLSNKPSNTSHMFVERPDIGNNGPLWALRTLYSNADIMITSGSHSGLSTYVPKHDKSEEFCYVLTSPPFVNTSALVNNWNARVKTWFTEILTKGKGTIGSGFDELVISGSRIKHTFFTDNLLNRYADKEKRDQAGVLAKMIERSGTYESVKAIDNKDRIQIENKLPREISNKGKLCAYVEELGFDRKSAKDRKSLANMIRSGNYSQDKGIGDKVIEFFSNYIAPKESDTEISRTNFVVVTDVHIGSPGRGYPNQLLLDAAVGYINKNIRDRFVLSLMGDNIEGNLRDHKNEMHIENDYSNEFGFRQFLESKGISKGSQEYDKNMNEYIAWLHYKTPIANTNSQVDAFIERLKPLINDSGRVSGIVVADGNHLNKSYIRKDITESGELFRGIIQSAPEKIRSKAVRVYGGDYGHDNISVGDLGILFSHNVVARKMIDGLNMNEPVAIGGDLHIHKMVIRGGKVVFTGAQMQGDTGFPQTVGIPVSDSLRGFSILSVDYDPENKERVLAATDTFINLKHLKECDMLKENKLIKEYEDTLRRIEVKPEKIRIR